MRDTFGEARTNSKVTFFNGHLHMDVPVLADQQELANNISLRTQDVVLKTCQKQCVIGMNSKRESGKSVLAVRFDDDIYMNVLLEVTYPFV